MSVVYYTHVFKNPITGQFYAGDREDPGYMHMNSRSAERELADDADHLDRCPDDYTLYQFTYVHDVKSGVATVEYMMEELIEKQRYQEGAR